jgi:hypothetical protein
MRILAPKLDSEQASNELRPVLTTLVGR